jgi:hypothetical protein
MKSARPEVMRTWAAGHRPARLNHSGPRRAAYVLWNGDPVQRGFRTGCVGRLWAVWPDHANIWMATIQRDHAPSHVVAAGVLRGGKDMSANRAIGIPDHDRGFQDGLKGLTDIKALSLTADEDRYRREVARHLARRLGGGDPRGLCRDSGFAGRRRGVELRLQLRFGGGQLGLDLGGPRGCLRLGLLSPLFCLSRPCGGDRTLGGRQLRFGSALQIFRHPHRHHRARGFSGGRHSGEFRRNCSRFFRQGLAVEG